jgi:hypothetical protein
LKKIINIKLILTASVLLLNSLAVFALQAPGGEPPCGGPFAPCVPIDGGIGFLIALGIGYGAKKAIDNNNKKKAD